MNKFHKLICIILCLAAVFALPLTALADEEETTNYLTTTAATWMGRRKKGQNATTPRPVSANARLLVVSIRATGETSKTRGLSSPPEEGGHSKVNVKQLKGSLSYGGRHNGQNLLQGRQTLKLRRGN